MNLRGLEPHTFYYPGRCPKLEEISNPCLTSECIIINANNESDRVRRNFDMHLSDCSVQNEFQSFISE